MSVKSIARVIGSVVAIVAIMALYFLDRSQFPSWINIWWAIGIAGVAAIIMFIITPYITVMPYHWMRNTSASDLLAAVIGLVVGLIISVLLGIPLSNLPANLGRILPFVGAVVFSCLGVAIAIQRKNDIMHLFQTGFISGALVVPRFVLNELQHIADSADTMRRNRGRRGLEMLNRLQKDATVPIEITDADVEGIVEVDSKLVKLAQTLHCPIITNDFNLNRVAELQGVKVLNINELANAVKPVLLPGEDIVIKIIQDGKELGQGVGYLDDGTMIVVEGGRQYMGSTIEVSVTRVLQTVAGRMIFAHPKQQGGVSSVPSILPPSSSTTKQK